MPQNLHVGPMYRSPRLYLTLYKLEELGCPRSVQVGPDMSHQLVLGDVGYNTSQHSTTSTMYGSR